MMIVKEVINTCPAPIIPSLLKSHITLVATYNLTRHEASLLSDALSAVSIQMIRESYSFIFPISIVITCDGSISLELANSDILGVYLARLILYAVQRWRDKQYSDRHILTIYIEALYHCIWDIYDETEVNYKVLEIFKHIFPNITITDLYNMA